MDKQNIPKLILLLVLLLVLIGGVYWLFMGTDRQADDQIATESEQSFNIEHVNLLEAQNEQDRLPPGFPEEIPVELEEVDESYVIEYGDLNATQYSISYRSNASLAVKFQEYNDYMNSAGYEIETSELEGQSAFVFGNVDGNDLSVSMIERPDHTYVQISYIQRN